MNLVDFMPTERGEVPAADALLTPEELVDFNVAVRNLATNMRLLSLSNGILTEEAEHRAGQTDSLVYATTHIPEQGELFASSISNSQRQDARMRPTSAGGFVITSALPNTYTLTDTIALSPGAELTRINFGTQPGEREGEEHITNLAIVRSVGRAGAGPIEKWRVDYRRDRRLFGGRKLIELLGDTNDRLVELLPTLPSAE